MGGLRDLDVEQVARIRADMQRQHAAFGCELGSVFTLIAVGGFVGYLLAGHAGGDWSVLGTLARGLTWVVSMSVVGKLLGLGYERLRLIQLGREPQPPPARTQSLDPPPLTRSTGSGSSPH